MKRKNEIRTAACLCALLVTAASVSCGGAPDTVPQTGTDTGAGQEETTQTAETSVYDSLKQEDFGGYGFRILNNTSNFAYTNMGLDGQTGESLDDVIYERNARVEDALNIKILIEDKGWDENKRTVENMVQAGEDFTDIYFNELYMVLGHALNGYLIDMTGIDTLNFDNPWWNKSAMESASIGDSIYTAFGDLHLMYYECFIPVVFNKQILNDLDLEDPYQLVRSGKWTIDRMSEMVKAAKYDMDGDGKWTVNDRYGLGVWEHNVMSLMSSAGVSIVSKGDNNLPVWNGLSESFINVYDKLIATLFADKSDNVVNASGFKSDGTSEILHVMMQQGQVLFYIEPLGSVKKMRNVDYEIGVVPTPKYDEAQEEYQSYIYHGAGTMAIPKTNPDVARTGTVAEYLAAYSHETVMQTYFDETLDFKYIQDDEGQAMLDIIFSNGSVDLAKVYGWGDVGSKVQSALFAGKSDIVSTVEKVSAKIESAIAETIAAHQAVE
ncbi:MAG: hypothetical protein ACI3XM_11145 [Eubacteriales bacterium]